MELESSQLLIEQLRSANLALTAQVEELTSQLAERNGEAEAESTEAPWPQSNLGTGSADAALELVRKREEAARAAELAYVEPLRARGMSIGTASDYHKYMAGRR